MRGERRRVPGRASSSEIEDERGGLAGGATLGQPGGQRRRTDATRRHGAGEERGRR